MIAFSVGLRSAIGARTEPDRRCGEGAAGVRVLDLTRVIAGPVATRAETPRLDVAGISRSAELVVKELAMVRRRVHRRVGRESEHLEADVEQPALSLVVQETCRERVFNA